MMLFIWMRLSHSDFFCLLQTVPSTLPDFLSEKIVFLSFFVIINVKGDCYGIRKGFGSSSKKRKTIS